MGHLHLGDLPRTRKWQDVVGLIECGAGAPQVATATISAAEAGLEGAAKDRGLVEAIWLLTQIPLAARSEDFAAALRSVGIAVQRAPSLLELVGSFSEAIDQRLAKTGGRTDLGEMAQMAAVETLSGVLGERTRGLFDTTPEDVCREVGRLATTRQFSILTRQFFSRLSERYLNYFLSRTLSNHVGEEQRFSSLADQAEFSEALRLHCHEASRIVEDFSGEWFSKKNWETGGINRRQAAGFTHVAMQKMSAELKVGALPDDD